MRILFLSNFYPPVSRGGYEQWCQEVLARLRAAGHAVEVLTSDHQRATLTEPDPVWVHRELQLEMELGSLRNAVQFFTHRERRRADNLNRLKAQVERLQPDVIMIWGMWNLSWALAALAEDLRPGRVAYYLGDYWPTLPDPFENYWKAAPRNPLTGLPKLILRPWAMRRLAREERPFLRFQHGLFPSAFLQAEYERLGVHFANRRVIYGAIDTRPYQSNPPSRSASGLRLLCVAARLEPEKGIHTAIEAVGHLVRERGLPEVQLTIVGGNGKPEYQAALLRHVRELGLETQVVFRPPVRPAELPALYQQAGIFLFPSTWPEPFGRVIVEAMASGLAVVGTPVGGAAEIMVENETALIFQPDEPAGLAEQVHKLAAVPDLRRRLGQAGRERALQHFDLQRMAIEIEDYLTGLVRS